MRQAYRRKIPQKEFQHVRGTPQFKTETVTHKVLPVSPHTTHPHLFTYFLSPKYVLLPKMCPNRSKMIENPRTRINIQHCNHTCRHFHQHKMSWKKMTLMLNDTPEPADTLPVTVPQNWHHRPDTEPARCGGRRREEERPYRRPALSPNLTV